MKDRHFIKELIELLISKYGEKLVLEVVTEIQKQLSKSTPSPSENKAKSHGIKKIASLQELAEKHSSIRTLMEKYPDKLELIQEIITMFATRVFLPELKDTKRYLEQNGASNSSTISNRAAVLPQIVEVLYDLPIEELQKILVNPINNEYSSLGVLSEEILQHS